MNTFKGIALKMAAVVVALAALMSVPTLASAEEAESIDYSDRFDSYSGWDVLGLGTNNGTWRISLDQSEPLSPPNALRFDKGGSTSGIIFLERDVEISLVSKTRVTLDFQILTGYQAGLVVYVGTSSPELGDFKQVATLNATGYQKMDIPDFELNTEGKRTVYIAVGLDASTNATHFLIDDIEVTLQRSSASAERGIWESLVLFFKSTGFNTFEWKNLVMLAVAGVLFYLAIKKDFEPLLLIPIAFGIFIANAPYLTGGSTITMMSPDGGVMYPVYKFGVATELFPLLIFLGIGAMTDFGPLIANPKMALLGGAAQLGIFGALLGAVSLGYIPFVGDYIHFTLAEAASVAIIGSSDGPTTIYTATQLAPHLLGAVAVAAYSYMALVPVIQPPIMRALTTKKERMVRMEQLRPVSKIEKVLFPFSITIMCAFLIPAATPLVGMLMFGTVLRESGVTDRLSDTAQNALMNTVVMLLAVCVGATMSGDTFLQVKTLMILGLGLVAFAIGTAGGVLMGKLMYITSGGKVNPLIGSAGVSAVPMSARVSQKVAQEDDPNNYILMHAMGPNVSGVIGSAIAAGVLLAMI